MVFRFLPGHDMDNNPNQKPPNQYRRSRFNYQIEQNRSIKHAYPLYTGLESGEHRGLENPLSAYE
jgi:hypothetical protein